MIGSDALARDGAVTAPVCARMPETLLLGSAPMKFGLMYEIQIPEPHYPGVEQERYKQIMAQVELADVEGFDYFWTVEHHFLNEFSHCSAPEVLYGALSQRTRRIRIGHAVALLPGQYNHPVRVAERAAVLDIVSDGRVDLGTGRSTTLIEMDGFEVNPADTKAQWEEAISMIPRMWTEDTFSHEGRFYSIPPRKVIPKPVQTPHPPLWVACSQPDSFRAAGEMGLGVLCFNLAGYDQMAERVQAYREAVKHAKPVGKFVNNQVAALCLVHCAEDDEEARRVAAPEGVWFVNKAEELYQPWQGREVPSPTSTLSPQCRPSAPTKPPKTTWLRAHLPWVIPTRLSRSWTSTGKRA